MMSDFETVNLTWKGKAYRIAPDRVMRAIAVVEEKVTLSELVEMQSTNRIKISVLAEAYANLLRYAGAEVKDAEVYRGMFANAGDAQAAHAAVEGLFKILLPPGSMTEAPPKGKPSRAERRRASKVSSSSGISTKPRFATANG